MKQFEHGGNIKLFAEQHNCNIKDIIDLSSNINFVKPKFSFDFSSSLIESYPNYNELYDSLALFSKAKPWQIEIYNGASSAIFSLFNFLKPSDVILYAPIYTEYKKITSFHNIKINLINHLELENIYLPPKKSLVVLVNPTTPNGKWYDLTEIIENCKTSGSILIIDESFLEFSNLPSFVSVLNDNKNIYIIKSLTKIFGAAGVRVGIILSHEKNIKKLRMAEPLWKVSQFDLEYIIQAIANKNFINYSLTENNRCKVKLCNFFKTLPIVEKVFDSDANFLLVKLKGITANELQRKLTPFHIIIRNCANFDFLNEYYIRIAVKNELMIDKFEEAILCIISQC